MNKRPENGLQEGFSQLDRRRDKANAPFSPGRSSLIQGAAANARGRKDQS
jgi:hypothetical protein